MKKCTYCGKEYPDQIETCPTDGNPLVAIGAVQAVAAPTSLAEAGQVILISPEEQQFWQGMTFRQFAIIIVRLQALWLLFYAALDATHLTRFIPLSSSGIYYHYGLSSAAKLDLFLLILRIIAHVAIALAIIQHAEKLLSWLVKDNVPRRP